MAEESITWPSPPDFTDVNDGTQAYNLGRDFTLTAERPIVGVEWRVPDSLAAPGGGLHAVSIWDEASGTRLAYRTVTPTPGGVQRFTFDPADYLDGEVLVGEAGPVYTAAVYTNHYAYRPGAAVGSTSPSGVVVAGDSQLIPHNTGPANAPMPDVLSTANFFISPVVSDGETDDHTTTGTAGLTAAADGSNTTTRITSTSAPLQATASATGGSVRESAGAARVAVAVSSASGSERASAGVAGLIAGGGTYVSAGVAGPWLTVRGRTTPIVDRARRA